MEILKPRNWKYYIYLSCVWSVWRGPGGAEHFWGRQQRRRGIVLSMRLVSVCHGLHHPHPRHSWVAPRGVARRPPPHCLGSEIDDFLHPQQHRATCSTSCHKQVLARIAAAGEALPCAAKMILLHTKRERDLNLLQRALRRPCRRDLPERAALWGGAADPPHIPGYFRPFIRWPHSL